MRRTTLILLAVLAPASAAGQDVGQYHSDGTMALPDSGVELREGDWATISIVRTWSSDRERQLIIRAEALYPDSSEFERRAVALLTSLGHEGPLPQSLRAPGDGGSERWWWAPGSFDVLLPYALTARTVQYYLTLTQAWIDDIRVSGAQRSIRLEYAAQVDALDAGGHEVTLELRWRYHCGGTCGLSLRHSRRVAFDASGRVRSLAGDEMPRYLIF